MMKLVQNELIKLWKQTATKVVLIILAVLMIASPLLVRLLENAITVSFYSNYDYIEEQIRWMEEFINSEKEVGFDKQGYQAEIGALRFFRDNGFRGDSWQYMYFGAEYCQLVKEIAGLRLIADGEDAYTVSCAVNFGSIMNDEKSPFAIAEANDDYEFITDDEGNVSKKYNVSTTAVNEYIAELEQKLSQLTGVLKSDDSNKAVCKIYDDYHETAKYYEDYSTQCRKQYDEAKLNGYEDFDALLQAEQYEKVSGLYENIAAIVKFAADAGGGIDDWRITLANNAENELPLNIYAYQSVHYPKEYYQQYAKSYETQEKIDETYGKAVAEAEKNQKLYDEQIAVLLYAAENDIPFSSISETPSKTVFRSNLAFAFKFVLIFAVVIAAQIMSREYSSGTIRMLVIRPKKRHKLVTAKLVALVITILTCMVGAVAIETVMSLIINGTGDMMAPDIALRNGVIIEIPAIVTYLKMFGLAFLTIAFFTSVAFMFSILMKHSAVAITVSVILYLFASTVQAIIFAIYLNTEVDLSLLSYTILPYLDMSAYYETYSDYISSMMTNSVSLAALTEGISYYQAYVKFIPLLGTVIVALHTALISFVSYITFIKKQIKS